MALKKQVLAEAATFAHLRGECRPCAYFWQKKDGCRNGDACEFCHLCDQDALKRYKREKRLRLKAQPRPVGASDAGSAGSGDEGSIENGAVGCTGAPLQHLVGSLPPPPGLPPPPPVSRRLQVGLEAQQQQQQQRQQFEQQRLQQLFQVKVQKFQEYQRLKFQLRQQVLPRILGNAAQSRDLDSKLDEVLSDALATQRHLVGPERLTVEEHVSPPPSPEQDVRPDSTHTRAVMTPYIDDVVRCHLYQCRENWRSPPTSRPFEEPQTVPFAALRSPVVCGW